ncbi:CsiV family protein, partial [Stutzerimonas stutzeri]
MPRRYLALLLLWLAPQVHAEALYRVELILFRHATPLEASQHAPYDWARQARPLER